MNISPLSLTARQEALPWRRTTRAHPCPICGKTSWCQVSGDGRWGQCMRVEGGHHKVDAAGSDYWIHPLEGTAPPPPPHHEPAASGLVPERAPVPILDPVYRALLAALPLIPAHRENLRGRGLPDAEIDRRGYRSLPRGGRAGIARQIVACFGADVCRGVPGLYLKAAEGRGWWSLAGHAGLIIPVRDLQGRIIALKVRADDDDSPFRYSYISSRAHEGASPGAPPHAPLYEGDIETVRLTEGELKADVATVLGGRLCLSVAGVSHYRSALPLLWDLGTKTVRIAFDIDWRWKPAVARALDAAARALDRAGHVVMIETWD